MSFYYGSSGPPEEDRGGGFKDTVLIIVAVFRALALPLGIIFGGMFALVFLLWLFTISGWAGLAGIVAIALGLGAFGIWEYRHPPQLGGPDDERSTVEGQSSRGSGSPRRME